MKWEPIENAPKDGTWVLLKGGWCACEEGGDNDRRPVVGQWTHFQNGRTAEKFGRWQFAWYDGGYVGEYQNPTHFMRLPE